MTGPDLLNDLVNVLLRFRIGNYAATADISKAFLNVQLNVNDRDCCRFFWPDDPFDVNSKINVYHLKKYNNETSNIYLQKYLRR